MTSAVSAKTKADALLEKRSMAIRKGKWKLLSFERGAVGAQLYNLDEDLQEEINLAEEYPEIVDKMKRELLAWEKDVSENLPYRLGMSINEYQERLSH